MEEVVGAGRGQTPGEEVISGGGAPVRLCLGAVLLEGGLARGVVERRLPRGLSLRGVLGPNSIHSQSQKSLNDQSGQVIASAVASLPSISVLASRSWQYLEMDSSVGKVKLVFPGTSRWFNPN